MKYLAFYYLKKISLGALLIILETAEQESHVPCKHLLSMSKETPEQCCDLNAV